MSEDPDHALRRCERHGLVIDSDGRCTRCRSAGRAPGGGGRAMWLFTALTLTGTFAFAIGPRLRAYLAEPEPAPAPPQAPPRVRPAVAAPPPPVAAAPDAASDPLARLEAYADAARKKREAEQRAAAVGQVQIVMYSTSWCGYCQRARGWLGQQGHAYVDHDVEREPGARERMRAINPRGGVPVFEIDGEVVHGFDPGHLAQAIARAATRRVR